MKSFEFDSEALEIIERLHRQKFEAYFVGGCIRDLLMGRKPKDFDIATNARPRDIKRIVPYCFIIGKRFQLVLAKRGRKQFEIATFRKSTSFMNHYSWVDENQFGTAEDDATRRDFTLNALFYDPFKKKLIDFVHGEKDIKEKTIRVIGDPFIRFQEDPIRILRAVRFAAKLDFKISDDAVAGMKANGPLLSLTVPDRIREELLKIFREGQSHKVFELLKETRLLEHFLPEWSELENHALPLPQHEIAEPSKKKKASLLGRLLKFDESAGQVRGDRMVRLLLQKCDERTLKGAPLPVPMYWAAFLLPVLRIACFAQSKNWKTWDKNALGDLKFFNEMTQSFRLSKQESAHIRYLISSRPEIFLKTPESGEEKWRGSIMRNPGFPFLLDLCIFEAEIYNDPLLKEVCHQWQLSFDALLKTNYRPKPWETLGPYDKAPRGPRQPRHERAHHAEIQEESPGGTYEEEPTEGHPKKRRKRRRRKYFHHTKAHGPVSASSQKNES